MMSEYDNMPAEQLLDLYCDGVLPSDQRARFEQALADDPSLRKQVELQKRIDATLRSAFDKEQMVAVSPAGGRRSWGSQPMLAVAAVLMLAVSVGIMYSQIVKETPPPEEIYATQTMQDYYNEAVTAGFKPGWICEDRDEFARTFAYRLGQPILASVLPDGVKLLGLGYGRVLSSRTVTIFAEAKGERVLIFAEPVTAPRAPEPLAEGLNRFRREVDLVVLYEVSSLSEPHLIEHFHNPNRTEDGDGE